jgi:hypothetical protein
MKEALTYLEARRELEANAAQVRAAADRRGGRTMAEILAELSQRDASGRESGS